MERTERKAKRSDLPSLRSHFGDTYLARKIVPWYQKSPRPLPWRVTSGHRPNPWRVWVSEIMLQQTLIRVVIPVYKSFIARFPTPHALSVASEQEVKEAVRGLGYYRRFGLLHKGAKVLAKIDPVVWPENFEDWKKIPGVGDYTAAAISSIAFKFAKGVVDGNVERVLCRLFDLREPVGLPSRKRQFQKMVDLWIDQKNPGDFNQGIMELGQSVCTPVTPDCESCPLKKKCLAYTNASQHLAPAPKVRKPLVEVPVKLIIETDGNLVRLTQRNAQAKFLKNQEGFETYRKESLKSWHLDGSKSQLPKEHGKSIGTFVHNITHHKIMAQVFLRRTKANISDGVPVEEVEKRLVANLDRKAWSICLRHL